MTVPKVNLTAGAHIAGSSEAFYNYAARLVVERASWLARDNGLSAVVTFERVKGFNPKELIDYIDLLRARGESSINWGNVSGKIRVDSPANIKGLLVSDIVAGAFDSATRPDAGTGLVEHVYLDTLAPQIWHRPNQSMMGVGFKILGSRVPFEVLPWWPGPIKV